MTKCTQYKRRSSDLTMEEIPFIDIFQKNSKFILELVS